MSEEIDAYKIFRQLEKRKKRANPYTFYDKDELIDEILKQELMIEDLQQKVEQLENIRKESLEYICERFEYIEETGEYYLTHTFNKDNLFELYKILRKGE